MDKIYPVQLSTETPRRVLFEQLERRLSKWMIDLPDHLRYHPNDKPTLLPHVLVLHIEYHAAELLLHRALCVLTHIIALNHTYHGTSSLPPDDE